jgi:prophage regulatory protein
MRVLPYKDLKAAKGIPYSEEWIRNLVKTGRFPKPVRLGKKRVGFIEAEIDGWLKARAAERDVAKGTPAASETTEQAELRRDVAAKAWRSPSSDRSNS